MNVTPLSRTFQWLPITLQLKSKVLTGTVTPLEHPHPHLKTQQLASSLISYYFPSCLYQTSNTFQLFFAPIRQVTTRRLQYLLFPFLQCSSFRYWDSLLLTSYKTLIKCHLLETSSLTTLSKIVPPITLHALTYFHLALEHMSIYLFTNDLLTKT